MLHGDRNLSSREGTSLMPGPGNAPPTASSRSRGSNVPLFVLTVVAIATALAALVVASQAFAGGGDSSVSRSTFTDSFGRQCTQVVGAGWGALDCDYKPVESRLGSALEGIIPTAEPTVP
jgi:hypothetical protein